MGVFDDWKAKTRDAVDIAKHARNPAEVVKALIPAMAKIRILNEGDGLRQSAPALIASMRSSRNALKGHIIDGAVDYRALRESREFAELEAAAPALQHLRPEDLPTDADRNAFFINLYNVLAIHGVIALGIESSVMEVPSFFNVVRYNVGDEALSLDQIENGILRRNAPHPATAKKTLADDAQAHAFAPGRVDPRIHCALVCVANSCPPVGIYDAEQLDTQLDMASANFVNNEVRVDEAVHLPMIFRYYPQDWGGRAGIEEFVLRYADDELAAALKGAFSRSAAFEYNRYDWSLNVV